MYPRTHLSKVACQLNKRPRKTLESNHQKRDLSPVLRLSIETTVKSGYFGPCPLCAKSGRGVSDCGYQTGGFRC
jgi:hypothetical protein